MTKTNAERALRVFLVEDDPDDVEFIEALLATLPDRFVLSSADRLKTALERLPRVAPDVVLLDLHLPDSQGLDTFIRFHAQNPDLPVVVLTGLDDDRIAVKAVKEGAQDFLTKGQINATGLTRILRYAVERARVQDRAPAIVDRITGLYNRRGFTALAEQHLKLAQRTKRGFIVFFAILDGLDQINRAFGKTEGNQALATSAEILRENFRTSDVIARVGVDRFAIITPELSEYSPRVVTARLQRSQKYYNAQYNRYRLSLSMSASHVDPMRCPSIRELMAKVDGTFDDYDLNRDGRKPILK